MSYLHGYLAGLQWEPATRRREAPQLLVFGFKSLPDLIDFMQCWPLNIRTKCTNMALRFMYSFSCWSQLISSNTELPSMRVSATYNTPEKMLETTWFCHLHKLKVLKLITHPKHSSFNCLVIIAGKWRTPKRASYKDIEIVVSRDFCHCYCQWAESPSPVDLW